MAIYQSEWGAGRKQAPVSGCAGVVVAEKYEFTIGKDLAATDIVELAVLPAYHSVVEAVLISDDLGGATLDVGIMSGAKGDTDPSRTSGNEFFTAAKSNDVVSMHNKAGYLVEPVEADRSIGLKVSQAVTASGQKVILVLFTKQ